MKKVSVLGLTDDQRSRLEAAVYSCTLIYGASSSSVNRHHNLAVVVWVYQSAHQVCVVSEIRITLAVHLKNIIRNALKFLVL
jgi:hypothetical protein